MRLYGREWTRRELEAHVGSIGQIGSVRRMQLTEGKEKGVEMIQVRTGAGLAYNVIPSKGLDISLAELGGTPISWQSPNGDVHPAYYEAEGTNWLRTASGGLLMTCGLSHVGSPAEDSTGRYGLHGRVHHTPARQVHAAEVWNGDELTLSVSGVVEETAVFGSKLRLIRTISSKLGENRIIIEDRVENAGFKCCPHMMLYHFNFGFPLLGEGTQFTFPEADVIPITAGVPPEGYDIWEQPDPAAAERVYEHCLASGIADEWGMAEAAIHCPAFPGGAGPAPLSVSLRWSADTLPRLLQWRMPGAGEHVMGLEPANCTVDGVRGSGHYRELEPGESVDYKLELNLAWKS
ncbi:aldose 1-epimerase family protein [Paenibacillus nasutitermitis]|uniref:DUF4432 domain-containing protein n=1 Tax=Paenibacillus nasutitermitis TaxID=1652958 RepID=A0A916ZBG7_9BACL|nr:aldose 1-epimerase family protein [Paenibacillus nasutitermitis]GGD86267.1 DUF4432 domain-containing protein [Paenibacillus nasutitermitis]